VPTPSLSIHNFGPLSECNLTFGDLTVLVGPQASGKSIALQLLKLIIDTGKVQEELRNHGYDWHGKLTEFLELYFGEGMKSLWREAETAIEWCGAPSAIATQVLRQQRNKKERLFFIPAQRVLAVRDGWPRPFGDFALGDPFVVRAFSERLRDVVERELGPDPGLFPQHKRLKESMRELLSAQVFGAFTLKVETSGLRKRLVLGRGSTR
jgi:energy-coupling factor transporter ATP-binding protein EcfA2